MDPLDLRALPELPVYRDLVALPARLATVDPEASMEQRGYQALTVKMGVMDPTETTVSMVPTVSTGRTEQTAPMVLLVRMAKKVPVVQRDQKAPRDPKVQSAR